MSPGNRGLWAALLLVPSAASAQNAWEKPIAPGLVYREEIDPSTPRIVHALRLTLRSPAVKACPELAQGKVFTDDPTKGRATVSQMVRANNAIGGVNGDYFPFTGDPIGLMVRNGLLLSNPWPNRTAFGWGSLLADCQVCAMEATLQAPGREIRIDGINRVCGANELVLDTDDAGLALAKLPSRMVEVHCQNPALKPNGFLVGTADTLTDDVTSLAIEPATILLVANGSRAAELRGLTKLKVTVRTTGFDWSKVRHVVAGGPRLLRKGEIDVEWQSERISADVALKRHPRTAIGVTANGDLWLVAVDGRQETSDGATLDELAALMKRYHCVEAMNLDGGGSTTVNLFGLTLNHPSDGPERPVANGILLYGPNVKPLSSPLQICLTDDQAEVPGVPNAQVLWSASGDGWIDQGGKLRWFRPGKTTITAFVGGQTLALDVVKAPPTVPIRQTEACDTIAE